MTTAVAAPPKEQQALTIRQLLDHPKLKADIAAMLPEHCNPDRMMRVAIACLTRTPKLASCTQASFVKCMIDLSQWGLEPDGRRAHLIPYGTECQLIIDYKGYVELAYRSGKIKKLHSDVVHRGDIFEYDMGEVQHHVPWYLRTDEARPKAEGEVVAAYSMAILDDGVQKSEVMAKADVELIRSRSKAKAAGPWVTDWNEMAKKTAFRRLSKWLPLSAEIVDAMEADADRLDLPLQHDTNKRVTTAEGIMDKIMGDVVEEAKQEPASGPSEPPEDETTSQPRTAGAGSPSESAEPAWWLDYSTALADALDVDGVAAARDMYTKQCKTEAEKVAVLKLSDARFADLSKPKGRKKGQGALDLGEGQ